VPRLYKIGKEIRGKGGVGKGRLCKSGVQRKTGKERRGKGGGRGKVRERLRKALVKMSAFEWFQFFAKSFPFKKKWCTHNKKKHKAVSKWVEQKGGGTNRMSFFSATLVALKVFCVIQTQLSAFHSQRFLDSSIN